MQKCFMSIVCFFVCGFVMAMDFSGTYDCHLTDHSDGPFTATLVLKQDGSADLAHVGYGGYLLHFHVNGIPYDYVGMAAARGNDLALYFESTGSNKKISFSKSRKDFGMEIRFS